MGDKGKECVVETGKENGPPVQVINAKDAAQCVKAQKNQFAINRLAMMLMDIDPAELSGETIHDLKHVYTRLANILARQSMPDEPVSKGT